MQNALAFLVDTFFSLLFFVFLLRLVLQWVRADFRNPMSQAIVQLTNWLIMPLRRILPPIGRVDTASVVAVLLISLARVAAGSWAHAFLVPSLPVLLQLAVLELVRSVLWLYFWALVINALLSWIAPGPGSPAQSILNSICEPLLRPLRRLIPPLAGLDMSSVVAVVAIQFVLLLIA